MGSCGVARPCGTGFFTRAMGFCVSGRVVGVDIDEEQLALARTRDPERRFFATADARDLPYPDGAFDLVISITATCFIPDEAAAVREIVRVARHRGQATGRRLCSCAS